MAKTAPIHKICMIQCAEDKPTQKPKTTKTQQTILWNIIAFSFRNKYNIPRSTNFKLLILFNIKRICKSYKIF
ncbi:hypothetical protein CCAN12_200003 [Capnocytophaga canimorsus]|uniref:Uncharacterized protein n=1 Tax=Capnocytophaga canimorsus TaxID=28188 RepID=A0A0B7I462_9FLAO|nr:hypothetical protein CCAN12_200003 [Capnocytophaga canimorsus]CEN45564.1 hypothetical protein CCAN2_1610003 [Capnocytophaga canimorsus]CEN49414.1 hypothetical protein CCAN11_1930018 [Capnocytophaga canimorsus]